jgi:pimeloyl-ACP methyl ester carboxylesterase
MRNTAFIIGILAILFISLAGAANSTAFEIETTEKEFTVNIFFCRHTIKGVHYRPVPDTGKPLLVLVHGTTYGKWMWNVPGYSWVDHFTAGGGYPVLAVDRLGYGDSSRPNGDILTPRCQVHTLKQLLCQLRQSEGQRPIIWGGHSMGSLLGNMIAGESDLVDGLISMGWIHGKESQVGPPLSAIAQGDYITWTDEQRESAFYLPDQADPQIIAYDNLRADTVPRGAIWSGIDPDRLVMGFIDIPVFLAAGQYDGLWADIDLAAEAALYPRAPVTTFLQDDAGHTNILHFSHWSLLDEIDDWLETNFE